MRVVYLTPADQAELDVLVHALTADYFEHRERCRACQPDPPPGTPYPCPHVGRAIDEILDWLTARSLLTRAEELRAARNEAVA